MEQAVPVGQDGQDGEQDDDIRQPRLQRELAGGNKRHEVRQGRASSDSHGRRQIADLSALCSYWQGCDLCDNASAVLDRRQLELRVGSGYSSLLTKHLK